MGIWGSSRHLNDNDERREDVRKLLNVHIQNGTVEAEYHMAMAAAERYVRNGS
jgi:hypothetical protein